jgi:hypothetical protein
MGPVTKIENIKTDATEALKTDNRVMYSSV